MKNRNEKIIEEEEIFVSNSRIPAFRNSIELYLVALIFALIIVILGVGGLIWLSHLFPIIQYAYIGTIAALPLTGMGFLGVALYRYIKKAQVIAIAEKGNIIRLPGGNVQVFSTEEVFAYETKDANPLPILLPQPNMYKPNIYVDSEIDTDKSVFPQVFPSEEDIPTVSTTETGAETVLETLRIEQDQARNVLELKEREIIKARIKRLREMNLSLRSIAAIVHMQGRKYNDFKEICKEIGINTE